jgi:hypothetical protein
VDCRLSWLGGLPASWDKPERFSEMFGGQTNYGLYPRFIFGYSGVRFNYSDWKREKAPTVTSFVENEEAAAEAMAWTLNNGMTVVERIADDAQALLDAWEPGGPIEDSGRIKYNAKKISILKACFNEEKEVSLKRMRQAILFMKWQVRIREVFRPGVAKEMNREAWFSEHLIPALERAGARENFVSWRRISLNNHWDTRVDANVQLRTVKGLVELGRLIEEDTPVDKGEKKPKYPKVKLRVFTHTFGSHV